MKYTVAVAGSTKHTAMCANALVKSGLFEISWILTPVPRPVGRKQVLTKNALQLFGEEHGIPILFVDQKIDGSVEKEVRGAAAGGDASNGARPDFFLVVDFGYLIPKWLLEWPKIAPLNIHPSDLPRWRGSSPGQFVLLSGEQDSAVSLIVMDEGLDSGPIIHKEIFTVEPTWTQTEYYHFSFALICKVLAEKLRAFAAGEIVARPQPVDSPTEFARRLTKQDGFVTWSEVAEAMKNGQNAAEIERKIRAFSPWPGVWTMVKVGEEKDNSNGEKNSAGKRIKILSAEINKQTGKLVLKQVQLEGKTAEAWSEEVLT